MKKMIMMGLFLGSFFTVWMATTLCIAQEKFPTKPITLMVGFAAGGTGDLPLRFLAEPASKALGQPVVVINKVGGGGTVALGELKNSKPDGYTICFLSTGGVISSHMRKIPYHPVKDLEAIIQHGASPYGLVVQSSSPFKTLKDLIAYAKANPGKVNYSHAGAGTPQHLVMIQLAEAAGVEWTDVPMGGGVPAITALLGGHVTAAAQATEWVPYVKSGQLRLLALFTDKRMEGYPEIPTLVDLGYNIVAPSLYSVVGPRGIPKDRVKILHDALYKGMQLPEYKKLLARLKMTYTHRNSQEHKKYIEELYESSGKVVAKIKKK